MSYDKKECCNENGLYPKYKVFRTIDGSEVPNCFVLCPETDDAAKSALMLYAWKIRHINPKLASDLDLWLARCI
mgnify:CR=1 FL=1